jgi:hypothetical protein
VVDKLLGKRFELRAGGHVFDFTVVAIDRKADRASVHHYCGDRGTVSYSQLVDSYRLGNMQEAAVRPVVLEAQPWVRLGGTGRKVLVTHRVRGRTHVQEL